MKRFWNKIIFVWTDIFNEWWSSWLQVWLAARRFADQIVSSLTMFISELFVLNYTIFLFMSLLLLTLYSEYLTAFYLGDVYDYVTFDIRISVYNCSLLIEKALPILNRRIYRCKIMHDLNISFNGSDLCTWLALFWQQRRCDSKQNKIESLNTA